VLEVTSDDAVSVEEVITDEFADNDGEVDADDCCAVELDLDIIEDVVWIDNRDVL